MLRFYHWDFTDTSGILSVKAVLVPFNTGQKDVIQYLSGRLIMRVVFFSSTYESIMNPYFTKTQFYDYTILSGPLLAPLRYNREVGSRDYTLWAHCYTRPSSKRRDSRGGLGSIPTRASTLTITPSYCLEACNQYENTIIVSIISYSKLIWTNPNPLSTPNPKF